jgi:hypothetical protein
VKYIIYLTLIVCTNTLAKDLNEIARPKINNVAFNNLYCALKKLNSEIIIQSKMLNGKYEHGGIIAELDGLFYTSNIVTSRDAFSIHWSISALDSIDFDYNIIAMHHSHPLDWRSSRLVSKLAFSKQDIQTFKYLNKRYNMKGLYMLDKYGTRLYNNDSTGYRGKKINLTKKCEINL